jgi:hypothetical protein
MLRISALTAGLAAVIAIASSDAVAARACDERVVGSCPSEPIAPATDASAGAADTPQAASARPARERSVKRVRRSVRYARYSRRAERRAERRRAAPAIRAARRQTAPVEPELETEQGQDAPVGNGVAAAQPVPETAPILPPVFAPASFARAGNVGADPAWPTQAPEAATAAPPRAAPALSAPPPAVATTTNAAAGAPPAAAEQAETRPPRVASAPAEQPDGSWLRVVFVAFGGLLAAGSVLRLLV